MESEASTKKGPAYFRTTGPEVTILVIFGRLAIHSHTHSSQHWLSCMPRSSEATASSAMTWRKLILGK